ncbi:MAG TPA: GAF domain-containing protein [Pseudolabrys sp.]|nr:GAF domain-containing protein [Pseudolabrys sp.]
MDKAVVSLNIRRFRKLLESETSDDKRRTLIRLLAEEQKKIDAAGGEAGRLQRSSGRRCEKCNGPLQFLTQGTHYRPPDHRTVSTYFGCTNCVHMQIDDRTTSTAAHFNGVLERAIAELGAGMGSIQLFDRFSQTLFIAAHKGFARPFLDYFSTVSASDDCASGVALREKKRIVVEDVEAEPGWKPMLSIAREAGFRAVQSTPLIGRDGSIHGVLSTHFKSPHRPSESDFSRMGRHLAQALDIVD